MDLRAKSRPYARWRDALFGAAAALLCAAQGALASGLPDLPPSNAPAHAFAPLVTRDADGAVRFSLPISEPLAHHAFTLIEPDRIVVDLPELEWMFEAGDVDLAAAPAIADVRFGLFQPGRSRLVLELAGAPDGARVTVTPTETGATLSIAARVASVTQSRPAALEERRPPAIETGAVPPTGAERDAAFAPQVALAPRRRPRPLTIVLDPGHGGRDPGAVYGGLNEKDLTLDFARQVRRLLHRPGRIHVALTRDSDVFVPLDERVRRAQALEADAFISIHADALPGDEDVSGASVYTLSERASDRLADSLARRENAADGLAAAANASSEVVELVVDYKRRRSMDDSHVLADVMLEELGRRVELIRSRPHRYAGFRVLKNFEAASVLVELGFLTNVRDRRRFENPHWRARAAEALASGVERWAFRDRSAPALYAQR